MAKTKVAPARPKKQAPQAAGAIPLSDVTITWYRQPHFLGEEGRQAIAIPGRQLGQILSWLAQTRPGLLGKTDKDLWSPEGVALDLEGLGGVLSALAQADDHRNVSGTFYSLANIIDDLTARLSSSEDADEALKDATIALPTRTKAAA